MVKGAQAHNELHEVIRSVHPMFVLSQRADEWSYTWNRTEDGDLVYDSINKLRALAVKDQRYEKINADDVLMALNVFKSIKGRGADAAHPWHWIEMFFKRWLVCTWLMHFERHVACLTILE